MKTGGSPGGVVGVPKINTLETKVVTKDWCFRLKMK